MRTILCYGDSNTWGYDPVATATSPFPIRHAPNVRWTGVLARELGDAFRVVEEGQNGRTTVHEDSTAFAPRNGRAFLPVCLESQKPIDLVVLMLGSNDLKTMFSLPAQDIANGAGILVKMISQSDAGPDGRAPKVLLVCPPTIGDLSHLPDLAARLAGAREKSLELPKHYALVAKTLGVGFFNAQEVIEPSVVDGIHFEGGEHAKLGKAMATAVRAALGMDAA